MVHLDDGDMVGVCSYEGEAGPPSKLGVKDACLGDSACPSALGSDGAATRLVCGVSKLACGVGKGGCHGTSRVVSEVLVEVIFQVSLIPINTCF